MKEVTIQEAERIAGGRLDRRRRYATTKDGKPDEHGFRMFSIGSWTQSCSGCHETNEGYEFSGTKYDKNGIALGSGCPECGYTGKRRESMWLPHDLIQKLE